MLQIAICDHNESCQKSLMALVGTYLSSRRELSARIYGVSSSSKLLAEPKKFGIVLVSAQWEGAGLEIVEKLRKHNKNVIVIFYSDTEEPEQAIQAYRLQALQYMVKPFHEKILFETLDRAVCHGGTDFVKRIVLNSTLGLVNLRITDILYARSQGHRITFFLRNNKMLESKCLRISFGTVCEPLLRNGFIRCHDSYVVNLAYVEQLTPEGILISENVLIPVSTKKRSWVKDVLKQLEI